MGHHIAPRQGCRKLSATPPGSDPVGLWTGGGAPDGACHRL